MYEDLYCKIFINTNMTYEELFLKIKNFIDGKKDAVSYIITDWCEISVRKNKDYDMLKYLLNKKDFVFWKYYLDMEPNDIEETEYIKRVSDLVKYLKKYCSGVIVACEFEDELKNIV